VRCVVWNTAPAEVQQVARRSALPSLTESWKPMRSSPADSRLVPYRNSGEDDLGAKVCFSVKDAFHVLINELAHSRCQPGHLVSLTGVGCREANASCVG